MEPYDRGYGRRRPYDAVIRPRGYDAGMRRGREGLGSGMRFGRWEPAPGRREPGRAPEFDRGHFGRGDLGGDRYAGGRPEYGGYTGPPRGMGIGPDRQSGPGQWRGQSGGYDQGFAREPFLPEEVYQRHPEYMARPHHWDDQEIGWLRVQGREPDDGDVYQSVRAHLLDDRFLNANRIQVMVEDGVVTMEGEVDDFLQARYAWDDAWETPGVRGVVNHLTVRTDRPHVSHQDEFAQTVHRDSRWR